MARIPAVFFFLLLYPALVISQTGSSYSFLVAGHAYGSHDGENIGLHPPLLASLHAGYDSTTAFIVFTGDIVNHSTMESWNQVDNELDSLQLKPYYVMGNHDYNSIGIQVFEDKFGGSYYSFSFGNELFIVLNSSEEQRSISSTQMEFLQEELNGAGDSTHSVFIFFHEVLWNSHEKYKGVRSNSRSRYDQITSISNYWEEIHPLLLERPDKKFYVIAGDVAGNPDAIAAFYDRWDHITLVASGMGEVVDENYLLTRILASDSVDFQLVPLNSELILPEITDFSVPPAPEYIAGPELVDVGSVAIEYMVPEVKNATSYIWSLPFNATGSSNSNRLDLYFETEYTEGTISVNAVRDGFGSGPPTSLLVSANPTSIEIPDKLSGVPYMEIVEFDNLIDIGCFGFHGNRIFIRIYDSNGRLLFSESGEPIGGSVHKQIQTSEYTKGVYFLSIFSRTQHIRKKYLIR